MQSAWQTGQTVSKEGMDPYLVNVCNDPLLSGCLVYPLPLRKEVLMGSEETCDIVIQGLGIEQRMCVITNHDGEHVVVCPVDPSKPGLVKAKSTWVVGRPVRSRSASLTCQDQIKNLIGK